MDYIATYRRTREIIENNSFFIKKGYGQNFLIDQHVVNKIITGSNITTDDLVIEIGPGIGGLTERLSMEAAHVTAVEIDKELIPILGENLSHCGNIDIINEDILKLNLNEIIAERGFKTAKIAANLPYYITTPIIMNILENRCPITSMTVMMQKEVGERIKAKPASKDYGALTLAVEYRAVVTVLANVPRNSFIPRPGVDSMVLRLDVLNEPPVNVNDEVLMFQIIKSAFLQRRKTLVNCLFNIMDTGLSKERLGELLENCGINPSARGETLTLKDFAALTGEIQNAAN